MNLKEARYRVAPNNKKCALCGYRITRRLSHDITAITCLLFGENVEDDHTCNFWKID